MKIGTSFRHIPSNFPAEIALKQFTSTTLNIPRYGEREYSFYEEYLWIVKRFKTIRGNCLFYFPESSWELINNLTEESLEKHVYYTINKYPGILHWDVVNEIMTDSGLLRCKTTVARKERMLNPITLIPDWLSKLFTWASQANPQAELFINDYRPMNPIKWNAILGLVQNLKNQGVRIDGIGIQIHHHLPRACIEGLFAWKSIRDIVRSAKKLDLKVHFTEVSIWSKYNSGTALAYRQLLQLAKDEGVENITFWSLSDHPDDHWSYDGKSTGAGIYTQDYRLKPGMKQLFKD
jgi:GH35 family endo-1,4-beta-xylanase